MLKQLQESISVSYSHSTFNLQVHIKNTLLCQRVNLLDTDQAHLTCLQHDTYSLCM